MRLSACAEARSRPNGFSTMTRAPLAQPDLPSCSTTSAEQRRRDGQVVRRAAGRCPAPGAAPGRWPGRRSRRRRSAAGRHSLSKAAGSTPPCFSRLSRARALNWSRFQPALATPMTGTSSWPRLHHRLQGGKIFLYARSPVAPKNTRASEQWRLIGLPSQRTRLAHLSARRSRLRVHCPRLFEVPAELEAHRRQQLVGEVGLAARGEALVQGGR